MTPNARRWVLVGLELTTAVGALYGAWLGLHDPSGASFSLPAAEVLRGSPFADWTAPSLILLLVNGLLPLAVCVGLVRRHALAAPGATLHGLALAGWILVQVAIIHAVAALHVVFFVVGLAVAALGRALWVATR